MDDRPPLFPELNPVAKPVDPPTTGWAVWRRPTGGKVPAPSVLLGKFDSAEKAIDVALRANHEWADVEIWPLREDGWTASKEPVLFVGEFGMIRNGLLLTLDATRALARWCDEIADMGLNGANGADIEDLMSKTGLGKQAVNAATKGMR